MPADGGYTLQSRAMDYSNNMEAPLSGVNITVDNAEPSSAISSPKDGALISGAELAVTGTAMDDSGLGINRVQVLSPVTGNWVDADDTSGNGSWSAWSYSTTMPADGKYALQSRAVDNLGNIETPGAGNNITVDNTKPAGRISINNDSPATNQTQVTLTLSATDSSGVTAMRICSDGDFDAVPWESFAASKDWSLPAGDGEKTVYAQFMDAAGNESDTCSANILLDTASPVVNITDPAAVFDFMRLQRQHHRDRMGCRLRVGQGGNLLRRRPLDGSLRRRDMEFFMGSSGYREFHHQRARHGQSR